MKVIRIPLLVVSVLATFAGNARAGGFSVNPADAWRASTGAALDPELIDWKLLGTLDLTTGRAPASLAALDGKVVRIAAFIVPLEDDMQQADEFLLVPYFGACVHTPPPPPNQMVYVKMRGAKTVKIGWWDPVMFEGVIRLKQVDSAYGASYYEMEGISSVAYAPPKK
ncbi:MAG: DUF3299 domain-containing protein [Gemmatimonadota bacterium]